MRGRGEEKQCQDQDLSIGQSHTDLHFHYRIDSLVE